MPVLFDTHVHTSEVSPCGHVPGQEMANLYKDAGYDGVVVTDHFTLNVYQRHGCQSWSEWIDLYFSGYRQAALQGQKLGLTVLWAIELTLERGPRGDFLVYGLDEGFLLQNPDLFELDLAGFRDRIDPEKTAVFQAHPFRNGHELAPTRLLDGIEVINANPRHYNDSQSAIEAAEANELSQIAGSDAHQPQDVGRAGITLSRRPRSIAEFVEMLKAGEHKMIQFCADLLPT